jgi:predicted DsbA family dithiol-disulfide isomerase
MTAKQIIPLATLILGLALGLSLGYGLQLLQTSSIEDESEVVYAQVRGEKIKGKDVADKVIPQLEQLNQQVYDVKKRAVEELIRQRYGGQSPAPEVANDNSWKKIEISKGELDEFLRTQNLDAKNLNPPMIENIIDNMKFQKMRSLQISIQETQYKELDVRWQIPLPNLRKISPGSSSVQSWGAQSPKVEIFVFGNLHCPSCVDAEKKLAELRTRYAGKIKISYRFYLKEKEDSAVRLAAEAAICADRQNQFWSFYQKALQKTVFTMSEVTPLAEALGIDKIKFDQCLSGREAKAVIDRDIEFAEKMKLTDVPVLVINGRVFNGRSPLEQMTSSIDSLLVH